MRAKLCPQNAFHPLARTHQNRQNQRKFRAPVNQPVSGSSPFRGGEQLSHKDPRRTLRTVIQTPEGTLAQIAEPGCGDPFLIPMASGASPGLRLCQILLESIDVRRSTLQKVTDVLIEHLPDFPQTRHSIQLSELAQQCEMHVTTVSRALDNKTCSTPFGPVALRRYISGSF